jgi:phosphohistidine swiveling domain-containing protein
MTKQNEPVQSEANGESRMWIIVPGKMPDKTCSINEMPEVSERKNYTLVANHVPGNLMGDIKYFGGVVVTEGSPLSHLAETARYYGIPCKIGIDCRK